MGFTTYLVQAYNASEPTDRKPVWAALTRNGTEAHALYDAIAHVQLNHADHATEWHLVRVRSLLSDPEPSQDHVPGVIEFRGRWHTPYFRFLNDSLDVDVPRHA